MTVESFERDGFFARDKAKTVVGRYEGSAQQWVASLEDVESLAYCRFAGPTAQPQRRDDVERRVRVGERLGGFEGAQRAVGHALDIDASGYHRWVGPGTWLAGWK